MYAVLLCRSNVPLLCSVWGGKRSHYVWWFSVFGSWKVFVWMSSPQNRLFLWPISRCRCCLPGWAIITCMSFKDYRFVVDTKIVISMLAVSNFLQIQCVHTEKFVLSVVWIEVKVEWKYVTMALGAPSVTKDLIVWMLWWFAGSSATQSEVYHKLVLLAHCERLKCGQICEWLCHWLHISQNYAKRTY